MYNKVTPGEKVSGLRFVVETQKVNGYRDRSPFHVRILAHLSGKVKQFSRLYGTYGVGWGSCRESASAWESADERGKLQRGGS